MSKYVTAMIFICFISLHSVYSQASITLSEVIKLAQENSLEYQESKNEFLKAYFDYKQFKRDKLPHISFNSTPFSFNRSLAQRYDFENNIETYRENKSFNSNFGINISQELPVMGGSLILGSSLSRLESFGESHLTSYNTNPFRISFSQRLFEHNPYRWEKREVPLKLKLAKMRFLQSEQELNLQVAKLYFALINADQLNDLAEQELKNADTLLIAGRTLLEIQSITPSELIELELKRTNAEISLTKHQQDFTDAWFELNKLLRGHLPQNNRTEMEAVIPDKQFDTDKLLQLAKKSNPVYSEIEQEKINLEKKMDQVEKQNRFGIDLQVSYGWNQGGSTINEALNRPQNQQSVSVGLSIPMFDWGENKDRVTLTRIESKTYEQKMETKISDFEQDLIRKVVDLNLTREIIHHAGKAKDLAEMTYETKVQQYKIGLITLQELSQTELNLLDAKKTYLESYTRYWVSYYELQKITLHDLVTFQPLIADFEGLIDMLDD